jgi:hypothetical protein
MKLAICRLCREGLFLFLLLDGLPQMLEGARPAGSPDGKDPVYAGFGVARVCDRG